MVVSLMPGFTLVAYGAEGDINSSYSGPPWVPYPHSEDADPEGDQQTGQASRDIVGDEFYPPAYLQFLDGGNVFAVRVRINACDGQPSNPEFKSFAYMGMDLDGDGKMDVYLGVYNPTGNNGRLGIYLPDPALPNLNPATAGITKPIASFQPRKDINYSFIEIDYKQNQGGDTGADPDYKGFSSYGGGSDPDYFITFVFNLADINDALKKAGLSYELTPSSSFTYVIGTATQDNSINGDINGMKGITGEPWPKVPPISTDGAKSFSVTFDKTIGDQDASPRTINVRETYSGSKVAHLNELSTNPRKRATDGGTDSFGEPIILTWQFVGWTIGNHYDSGGNLLYPTGHAQAGQRVDTSALTNTEIKALYSDWFIAPATISDDMTVYAVWKCSTTETSTASDELIHFDGNGGGWPNASSPNPLFQHTMSVDGIAANLPPNPAYGNGSTTTLFMGWAKNKVPPFPASNAPDMGSVKYYAWSEPITDLDYADHGGTQERTVYAVWWTPQNQNGRAASFFDNIGANPVGGRLLYIAAVPPSGTIAPANVPPNPTRQGFAFRGWSESLDGTGVRYLDPDSA